MLIDFLVGVRDIVLLDIINGCWVDFLIGYIFFLLGVLFLFHFLFGVVLLFFSLDRWNLSFFGRLL